MAWKQRYVEAGEGPGRLRPKRRVVPRLWCHCETKGRKQEHWCGRVLQSRCLVAFFTGPGCCVWGEDVDVLYECMDAQQPSVGCRPCGPQSPGQICLLSVINWDLTIAAASGPSFDIIVISMRKEVCFATSLPSLSFCHCLDTRSWAMVWLSLTYFVRDNKSHGFLSYQVVSYVGSSSWSCFVF